MSPKGTFDSRGSLHKIKGDAMLVKVNGIEGRIGN